MLRWYLETQHDGSWEAVLKLDNWPLAAVRREYGDDFARWRVSGETTVDSRKGWDDLKAQIEIAVAGKLVSTAADLLEHDVATFDVDQPSGGPKA